MTVPVYLLVGGLLLLWAFAVVRLGEKTWLSPGAVLLLIYGIHCFLDPTLRAHYGIHPKDFNPDTWLTLSVYNAWCFAALVFGYMLLQLPLRRDKQYYFLQRPGRMFDRAGFFAAVLLCILVVGVLFVGLFLLGRFTLSKSLFTDYKPLAYKFIVSLYPILYVFVPALFASAYFDRPRAKFAAWLLVGLVALFVMSTLGRGMIYTILLTILIIYHFRYRKIKGRYLVGSVLFVGLATFVALLRRANRGILEIDLATIEQLLASGEIGFLDWFVYTVMIFDGQPVVSNVIEIVDDVTGPYYGLTYLNTVLMRAVPFDIPGIDFMPSPDSWYRIIRGFRFGSSGRGFSIIAESYMNFGRYGFVVFLFVGMLVRYLSFKVYTTSNPVMLLWSSFSIVVLIVALRDDSLTLFMRVVWYIFPLIVFRRVLLLIRQLSHPPAHRIERGAA